MKFIFKFRFDTTRGRKSVSVKADDLKTAISKFENDYFPGYVKHIVHIYEGNTPRLDKLLFTTNREGAETSEAIRIAKKRALTEKFINEKYNNNY